MKNLPAIRNLPGYYALRKQVEAALLQGQQAIERAKVETYHKTGELVHKYILKNKQRADLGTRTIEKLAEDLGISSDIIWDCVRFYRKISVTDARRELPGNLTWTHFRQLIKIPDDKLRLDFVKRAAKEDWTYRELASKIQTEVTHTKDPKGKAIPNTRLVAKRGTRFTYPVISFEGKLRVSLGFEMRRQLPEGHGLKEGDIIESVVVEDKKKKKGKKEKKYSFKKSKRTKADLYTYKAHIEKIVDGDTLHVVIDCGFIMETRQYLRLRGIDCPENNTPEGKKAKAFVEKELKGLDHILIVSSRSDKYDRYLADVYYVPKGEKDYKFLNQRLLDMGHAVRMEF